VIEKIRDSKERRTSTADKTSPESKKKLFETLHALEGSASPATLLDLGLPPKSSLIGVTGESSSALSPPSLSDPVTDNARLLLLLRFSPICLALAVFLLRRALGNKSFGGQWGAGEKSGWSMGNCELADGERGRFLAWSYIGFGKVPRTPRL
jgi:hypothetical protein